MRTRTPAERAPAHTPKSPRDTARDAAGCFGYCPRCDDTHVLGAGRAREHAAALMREIEALRRLDVLAPAEEADPALSFDRMFPGGHGNMFGVLECTDAGGDLVVLRAFSSLKRGVRDVPGWVPPLLSAETYYGRIVPTQERIEELTARLEALPPESAERSALLAERRHISRELFSEMQESYRFRNFRGEERSLHDAHWPARERLVGGIGECCAPKLLDHAARAGLEPHGIAEFYWGDSETLVQGEFYPCCETRCRPILGFMLCGLDD